MRHWRVHDVCSRKRVRMELLFAVRKGAAPSSFAAFCHVVAAEASVAKGRLFQAVDRLVEHLQHVVLSPPSSLFCLLTSSSSSNDHVRGAMQVGRRDIQRREGHQRNPDTSHSSTTRASGGRRMITRSAPHLRHGSVENLQHGHRTP